MHHMGDGDPEVDKYGIWLLDTFAKEVEGRKNKLGGIYRAGTGSAMYYIRHAEELGLLRTADGKENISRRIIHPDFLLRPRGRYL